MVGVSDQAFLEESQQQLGHRYVVTCCIHLELLANPHRYFEVEADERGVYERRPRSLRRQSILR